MIFHDFKCPSFPKRSSESAVDLQKDQLHWQEYTFQPQQPPSNWLKLKFRERKKSIKVFGTYFQKQRPPSNWLKLISKNKNLKTIYNSSWNILFNSSNLPPRRLDQSVSIHHVDLSFLGVRSPNQLPKAIWLGNLTSNKPHRFWDYKIFAIFYWHRQSPVLFIILVLWYADLVSGEVLIPPVKMSETFLMFSNFVMFSFTSIIKRTRGGCTYLA